MEQQQNKNIVFSLAKSIYYVHFSIQYLQDVNISLSGEANRFILGLINSQKTVLNNLYNRMPKESRQVLKNELENSDIAAIDSIMNLLVALDNEERLQLENYIELLIKNKKNEQA